MSRNAALKSAALLLVAEYSARVAVLHADGLADSFAAMDYFKMLTSAHYMAINAGATREESHNTLWAAWWAEEDRLGVPRTVRR